MIFTEKNSTFVETRALDLTCESLARIRNVCGYLLLLRDDTNGDLYFIDEFDSFQSVETFHDCIYHARPYQKQPDEWRRVELDPTAVIYELH